MSATDYPIPNAALDDRLGFVGTAGSGKTYNAGSGVERVLAAGGRVIIPDPLGVWWGLGLNADGQRPAPWREKGKLVIFGGERGDLPLNENAGALIGETVAQMAESAILDLSGFGEKKREVHFMLAFLTALYRHASNDPVHLIFDEADMWAPQQERDKGESPKLLGMMETIVRRGRVKGFIPWLISQRPAVLNKNVLSQVDGLVAFKLTSSQDRKAIGDWVSGQADQGEWPAISASLPTLATGTGIVWLPSRNVLNTAAFPLKATFDSSRTPTRGERVERRDLKPLNLEALKGKLASLEEEQKANDPRALKARVAELERKLAQATYQMPPAWPDQREDVKRLSEELAATTEALERLTASAKELERRQKKALAALSGEQIEFPGAPERKPATKVIAPPIARPAPMRQEPATQRDPTGLRQSHQKVLDSLAWWKAAGFPTVERRRACIMAGYSPKASTFGVYISELTRDGLVVVPEPGRLALTPSGEALASAPDMTSPAAILDAAREQLSPAEIRLFNEIVGDYPKWVSRHDLADRVGLSRTASTLGVYLSKIGSFDFIETGRGQVRAADWLFP
ncbi:MAG: hypothetical protein ACR652_17865 [Methylocystis sp.]|uniref:hypothetical protein n=1 Tax=Methylocystis sp. TaxID=1911079 RepID=UPI003DA25E07